MRYFHYLFRVVMCATTGLTRFLGLAALIGGLVADMPEAGGDEAFQEARSNVGRMIGFLSYIVRNHGLFICVMMALIAGMMYHHDTVKRDSRARYEKQKEERSVKGGRRRKVASRKKRGK
ncbi:hypothetical protein [Rhizobium sp. CSW-27]|uniref:hypothetical protein n=1 Tax=Rhizobium sp. CSW-27 TaxID=2839985 RepID=UPI001C038036|nr:hypothetical protein [Rhizobium sp. CSW-27]MBT9370257.1 hypothetical protein [Rhizobium sp. CSW-27]